MKEGELYSVEKFSAEIPADRYIREFRDAPRFMELCKACPNFGNTWACPPFDIDTGAFLSRFKTVRLFATKMTLNRVDVPVERAVDLLLSVRMPIETELLELERQLGGRAFSNVGRCVFCPEGECTRSAGEPCRHPEKVRPSLEAFGFNIDKTLSELFGIEIKWGKDGFLPEYLVLVSGLFY